MVTTTPLSDSGRSGACSKKNQQLLRPTKSSAYSRYQMVTTTPLSDSGRSGACRQ
jgi:hypothetical protein